MSKNIIIQTIYSDNLLVPPTQNVLELSGNEGKYEKINETGNGFDAESSLPYKSYTALLTQSSTDAPTAIVLQNTLGGIPVLSRAQLGSYLITLSGAFPNNKVVIPNFISFDGNGTSAMPVTDEGGNILGYYAIYRASNDQIAVDTLDDALSYAEWSTVFGESILQIDVKVF